MYHGFFDNGVVEDGHRTIGYRKIQSSFLTAHTHTGCFSRTREKKQFSLHKGKFDLSKKHAGEQQQASPSPTTKLQTRLDILGLPDGRFADRLLEGCFHLRTTFFIRNVPRPPFNILHLPLSSRNFSASISAPSSIACAFIATQTSFIVHSSSNSIVCLSL